MTQQVQMAPAAGIGGVIQGLFGTYPPASDGSYTVDVRDAPGLLAMGMNYVRQTANSYAVPIAPAAATVGAIVSSGALSNGSVSVTAQPGVPRQVAVEVSAGTVAITAGTIAVTYIGNDGISGTDTLSLVLAAGASFTTPLSRGVVTISSITVAGLVGGASPFRRLNTTAVLSVPVAPNAIDFSVIREYDDSATIAVGTVSTTTLGSIAPTTAPNGTHTYSFAYSYVAPTS